MSLVSATLCIPLDVTRFMAMMLLLVLLMQTWPLLSMIRVGLILTNPVVRLMTPLCSLAVVCMVVTFATQAFDEVQVL